jgi:hypothetical protein
MPGRKKQGYKARQDESLGARRGARSKLKRNVSAAGRRKMASAPRKAAGGKPFGFIGTSPKRKK